MLDLFPSCGGDLRGKGLDVIVPNPLRRGLLTKVIPTNS